MSLDPALPPSLAAELADLKRRLANLERSPQIPFSSTRGGAFILLDTSGNKRQAMGNVNLDGSIGGVTTAYGIFQYGDGGAIILAAREGDRGLVYPAIPFPFHRPDPVTVTSGTFITIFEAEIAFPAHEVLACAFAVQSDSGTTGEIRLREGTGGVNTNVASIPAAYNGSAGFKWVHPAPTGLYDPRVVSSPNLFVGLQARRTGGAGNLFVYPPTFAELTSKFMEPTANTNGNPQVA